MKKQLILAAALFAAAAQSAPSAINPKYLLPAICGIQGEHMKLHNLLQNMAPQAAAQVGREFIAHNTPKADTFQEPLTTQREKQFIAATKRIQMPLALKYALTYATPVGRRAPKGFHRARMQQLASILKFVNPEINARVGDKLGTNTLDGATTPKNKVDDISLAIIAALKHVPEIASRRELANRLSKTGKLVSSWSVPADMRGKKYLMFQGPVGYAIRNLPSLLSIVKEAAQNYQDFTADKTALAPNDVKPGFGNGAASKVTCKLTTALNSNLVNALPFFSLTTKYYMLESDYQKLPAADQVAVYQAVYEDVTDFADKLVNVLAPRTDIDATMTWGKKAWADPKGTAIGLKDAGIEKAKAVQTAAQNAPAVARQKYNDFMAQFQKPKP